MKPPSPPSPPPLLLLFQAFACVCVLTVPARVSAVTTDTVVGVAGRTVMLPCRLDAAAQEGVEVCWGQGQPSLFNCHNAVINAAGDLVTYRRSYRFSMSSSSSLSIRPSRSSDSGFYHCRVQLRGLFNDQTSSVHLIIINPPPVDGEDSEDPPTGAATEAQRGPTGHATEADTGSDVISVTPPMVAEVQHQQHQHQHQQQLERLQMFVGNTLRFSFIIFIPVLLLSLYYRVCGRGQTPKPKTDSSSVQSEQRAS